MQPKNEPEPTNPYANETFDDTFRIPDSKEKVSTGCVALIVLGCVALCVVLFCAGFLVLTGMTAGKGSSTFLYLVMLCLSLIIPLVLGFLLVSWLRRR